MDNSPWRDRVLTEKSITGQKRKQKLALLDQLIANEPDAASSRGSAQFPSTVGVDTEPTEVVNTFTAAGPSSIEQALTNHGWDEVAGLVPGLNPMGQPTGAPIRAGDSLGSFIADLGDSALISIKSPPPLKETPAPGRTNKRTTSSNEEMFTNILEGVQNLSRTQKRDLIAYLQSQTGDLSGSSSSSSDKGNRGTNSESANSCVSNPERLPLVESIGRFMKFARAQASGNISPAQLTQMYVHEAGFFAAVAANAYALGMLSLDQMMREEGVSPFSIGPETGHHPSQLHAVRSRFLSITPDLQPTDSQLTIGHHPYIDVIPWRTFRENTLRALYHDPPLIDENELCDDFAKGGLVCWGSQRNSLGMEAGVPWDRRSWEPKVWFLRKWWFLVGGWDQEMWNSARWWYGMRGDKFPES